jgi:hypothetical protein
MKKTFMTCLAVAALFAIASSATAITCTLDQRPGATLLVPYFQVSIDPVTGAIDNQGALSRDTILTIGNASSAPMIAHVNVYNRYSEIELDFNVALSGFDVQAMAMSQIISGNLPVTLNSSGEDVCQRPGAADIVYVNGATAAQNRDGYLRVSPTGPTNVPATPQDNVNGTTDYSGTFFSIAKALATDCAGDVEPLAIGYIVVDHANYCNLSDPTDANYYINDAIGMENNLFGEIIFTSGNGLPTYGISTVNLEADVTLGAATQAWALDGDLARTFYARYLDLGSETVCTNCGSGDPDTDLSLSAPWDEGFGDQREPLGLRWAARWFDLTSSGVITTNYMVWRASDSFSGNCDVDEPTATLTFLDEDENGISQGGCPSPCSQPQFNFPYETQQRNITDFQTPSTGVAGWVQMDFSGGQQWDQAWVGYAFLGSVALESVLIPATQLDPSTCNPLGVSGVQTIVPVIPSIPTGTGL